MPQAVYIHALIQKVDLIGSWSRMIAFMSGKRSYFLLACVFGFTALVLYANSLKGEFVFDDYEYIVENESVHDITQFSLSDPRQVGYLSFALNYAVGGDNPFGYHLVNVVIHAANATLVFLLVRVLLIVLAGVPVLGPRDFKIPLLTAALFLVHPLQTQAVSYITQRFSSLAALFYLLSVYAYLEARVRLERERRGSQGYLFYAVSFLATVLAMRTKEISFTIPFMLAAAEAFLFKGSVHGRRRFLYLIPFAASLVIIPLAILGPEIGLLTPGEGVAEMSRNDKIGDLQYLSSYEYLLTQFRVLVIYLRMLILPVHQSAVYDLTASRTFFDLSVIGSFGVLLAIIAGGIIAWRRSAVRGPEEAIRLKLCSAGIFWFFLAASVESSVIPIKDLIFEHRVYLPSVGAFLAAAAALTSLADRSMPRASETMKAMAVLLLCLPLGLATYARNDVWSTELKFWDDIVNKHPDKPIGYNNRANAYARIGRNDLALRDFNKTIGYFQYGFTDNLNWEKADLNAGNMGKTYMMRSMIYQRLGNPERAEADARRAMDIGNALPELAEVSRRAEAHYRRGEYKAAIAQYTRLLDWDPEIAQVLNARGNVFLKNGHYAEALRDFDAAINVNPEYAAAFHGRAMARARAGDKEKAAQDFARACSMGFHPACEEKY